MLRLIAAFVRGQIRIVPLLVFLNVFANINACVWVVCVCLQRLSVTPPPTARNGRAAFGILP